MTYDYDILFFVARFFHLLPATNHASVLELQYWNIILKYSSVSIVSYIPNVFILMQILACLFLIKADSFHFCKNVSVKNNN